MLPYENVAAKHDLNPPREHADIALRPDTVRTLIARTHSETARAKQLRYRVFVEEKGWEAPKPDHVDEESDVYDAQAVHGLLFDAVAARDIGAVRVILPGDASSTLPMQKLCTNPLLSDAKYLSRACEVSRLCILKEYRAAGGIVNSEMECSLLLRLVGTITEIALENRKTALFALMEEKLQKKLAFCGIEFNTIGDPVEHRGVRYPTMLEDIGATLAYMRSHHRAAWRVVSDNGRLELMSVHVANMNSANNE